MRSRTDVCGLADEQPSGRGALGVVRRSFLGLHALSVRSAAGERRIDDLVRQLEARELARLEELAHFLVWCAGVAGARLERGWGVAGAWLGRVWGVDRCRSRAKKIIIKNVLSSSSLFSLSFHKRILVLLDRFPSFLSLREGKGCSSRGTRVPQCPSRRRGCGGVAGDDGGSSLCLSSLFLPLRLLWRCSSPLPSPPSSTAPTAWPVAPPAAW